MTVRTYELDDTVARHIITALIAESEDALLMGYPEASKDIRRFAYEIEAQHGLGPIDLYGEDPFEPEFLFDPADEQTA